MKLDTELLEKSFEKVENRAVEFSADFYQKLFALHPELKPLFANADAVAQEKKLVASLAIIVENIRNPEPLEQALKSLGAYHKEVGTIREHYPFVGQALLETLAQYLGSSWNEATKQTWIAAYNSIAETMLEGAKNPQAYLEGELTFYDWLDLYGESSPAVRRMIESNTHFKYRNSDAVYKSSSER